MDRLGAADVPLDPGPGVEPRPWTAQHVVVMREVAEAFVQIVNRRRAWDVMRKEWRPPH